MPTKYPRSAVAALYAGLVLAVVSVLVVYLDRATADVLGEHIWNGYPSYSEARVDDAAMVYLIALSTIGVVGAVAWFITIRVAASGRQLARWLAAGFFVAGTGVALFLLTVRDTSGDTGLPALHGWVGLLPSAAGLVAVVLMWRRQPRELAE